MQEFFLNNIWRKQNFQRAQRKDQINLEFIWWSKFGQPRAAAVNYDTSPELSKHFFISFFSRPVQTDRSCETGASKSTSAPSRLLRRRRNGGGRKIGQRGSTASYFYLRRGCQVLERWELLLLLLLLLWGD